MEQAIYQVVVSTFEELGFMFPLEEEEEAAPKTTGIGKIMISVEFNGPTSGSVLLEMQEGVAEELAENMLCDEVNESMILDVAGEAGNVICGNLLPMIYGESAVYNLEAPKFVNDFPGNTPEDSVAVNYESGQLALSFFENK